MPLIIVDSPLQFKNFMPFNMDPTSTKNNDTIHADSTKAINNDTTITHSFNKKIIKNKKKIRYRAFRLINILFSDKFKNDFLIQEILLQKMNWIKIW